MLSATAVATEPHHGATALEGVRRDDGLSRLPRRREERTIGYVPRLTVSASRGSELAAAGAWSAVQERRRIQAEYQQRLVDVEVRATRRALLYRLRHRAGATAASILDEDFLAVAVRSAVCQAVIDVGVAVSGASAVDLQLYDPRRDDLRIAAQQGFSQEFLSCFSSVTADRPSACAKAWGRREPVLVDDIARSPIFTDETSLQAVLDAGSRAVYSYPLLSCGRVLGVLSFHHPRPVAHDDGAGLVAYSAAHALARSA